jgi:hypothetical protein
VRGVRFGAATTTLAAVISILSVTIGAASLNAADRDTSEPTLRLRVRMAAGLDQQILLRAKAEIDAIWRQYGVEFTWTTREHDDADPPPDLWIQFVDQQVSSYTGTGAIAWVPFVDGSPMPYVRVSRPAALALLATKSWVDDRPLQESSAWVRDVALGRIIGRAIAHEIGHYLLGSMSHAPGGLMRSAISTDNLIGPSRQSFVLRKEDVRALRVQKSADGRCLR